MGEESTKQSTTRVKRKGERGSPCLRPPEALILPLGLPLMIIEKFGEDIQPLIQDSIGD